MRLGSQSSNFLLLCRDQIMKLFRAATTADTFQGSGIALFRREMSGISGDLVYPIPLYMYRSTIYHSCPN